MRSLSRALRRYWWNEEHPVATEASFVLTLVVLAVIAVGSAVARGITEKLTAVMLALP
jgi:Flp pilus assembly pilin Flp